MKLKMSVIVSLGIVLLLTACGPKASDYYPLQKGSVWTYSAGDIEKISTIEIMADRKLDKKKVTPQKSDVLGKTTFNFLIESGKGIYTYATQLPGAVDPTVLTVPDYILKNPIKAGTTWKEEVKTMLMMETIPCMLTYTIADKKETVTVPAGTYKNCLKVVGKGSVEKDKGLLGVITMTVVHTDWYAPGVGLVKSVKNESGNHMLTGVKESIVQLTGYKK